MAPFVPEFASNEDASGNQLSDGGRWMYGLAERLFPLHRALTGPGNRETLRLIGKTVPLEIREVATGTQVFDWVVPDEWTIRDAFIADKHGRRVVDYRDSNLRVVSGSPPVDTWCTSAELRSHLFASETRPTALPYRTDLRGASWGFCVTAAELEMLTGEKKAQWRVVIDADRQPGSLTYAQTVLPAKNESDSPGELLVYAHLCHPSLANDNLSGLVVAAQLARTLFANPLRHAVRIVFAPATLGPLCWLAEHRSIWRQICGGMVLALVGDQAPLHWKQTRCGTRAIDRAAERLVLDGVLDRTEAFAPFGYDERQFCAPGIDMPIGRLSRSAPSGYPEYHTSDDNLNLISGPQLQQTHDVALAMLRWVDGRQIYYNQRPYGEPCLSRFQLHRGYGHTPGALQEAIMWVLNMSDGEHDLQQIAERSDLPAAEIQAAAHVLLHHNLLGVRPPASHD